MSLVFVLAGVLDVLAVLVDTMVSVVPLDIRGIIACRVVARARGPPTQKKGLLDPATGWNVPLDPLRRPRFIRKTPPTAGFNDPGA
ncbi:MAG: hypothetical protein M3N32_10810 [Actinomycetota bacterium]|nr:hypothetical protein [Actinomycetota bacterium]